MADYVELRCRSAFSFLAGASLPEDLVERAAALGYDTLALADARGVYGAPRFFQAARRAGIRALVGAEVPVAGVGQLWLLVESRTGYRNLCRLLTAAAPRRPRLHPPRHDARPGRTPAPRQRRAAPEAARGDGGALRRHARRHPPEPPHRRALRVHARGPWLPFSGVPARARRDADEQPPRPHRAWRARALPDDHAARPTATRARARHDRAARPRRLLPDRVGHRPLLSRARHPLPGARLGRQQRGLLRARHHGGRSGRHGPPLR